VTEGINAKTEITSRMQEYVQKNRKLFKFFGFALIILGILALAFPLATTIATKIFLGWIFLVSGLFQIWHSFSTREWGGFLFNLIIGALYVFTGAWLAFFPFTGIITLTFLLALTFILQGVLEAVMAFNMRPATGWVWVLLSGGVAVLAGFLIIRGLPSTAGWAIGLLVGINMISSGFAYLAMAFATKKIG